MPLYRLNIAALAHHRTKANSELAADVCGVVRWIVIVKPYAQPDKTGEVTLHFRYQRCSARCQGAFGCGGEQHAERPTFQLGADYVEPGRFERGEQGGRL